MAIIRHPQFTAYRIACTSSSLPISSTATTPGLMLRISIIIPCDFIQPSSTSVLIPTSFCGTPILHAAISLRSSAIPTVIPACPMKPSEIFLTISRSRVVFPQHGADTINVLYISLPVLSYNLSMIISEQPRIWCAILIFTAQIFRIVFIEPASYTTRPHRPTLLPPFIVIKPFLISSSYAYRE